MSEEIPLPKTDEMLRSIFGNDWVGHKMPEDSDEFDVKLVGQSFKVEWCESCGGIFVRCPKCGNNSCNGGYGRDEDDKECDVCPIAYELMYAINNARENK